MNANHLLKIFRTSLYAILTIMFLAYFILLNNITLIFYSVFIFIAFGLLLSIYNNYVVHIIVIAIILISSGLITYFVNIFEILQIYVRTIIATMILSLILTSKFSSKVYLNYALAALVAPTFLSIMGFTDSSLAINIVIVGYYLLVSAIISISINFIMHYNWSNSLENLRNQINTVSEKTKYITLIIPIILLMLPIWPSSSNLVISSLPYINITLYNPTNLSVNHPFLYPIEINADTYIKIENYSTNSNLDNLRFFYSNNSEINSFIDVHEYPHAIALMLNGFGANEQKTVKLVFFPIYYGFSNYTNTISNSSLANNLSRVVISKYIKASFGNLSGAYSKVYVNKTVTTYYTEVKNYTKNFNVSIIPYYSIESSCVPSTNISTKINVTSGSRISAFVIKNLSDMLNAVTLNTTDHLTYQYYLTKFKQNSYNSKLNSTSIHISALIMNESCIYYVLASPVPIKADTSITEVYPQKLSKSYTIVVPKTLVHPYKSNFSFINNGLSYLISFYNHEIYYSYSN